MKNDEKQKSYDAHRKITQAQRYPLPGHRNIKKNNTFITTN